MKYLTILLVLFVASAAQAQENALGITGSALTLGSSSELGTYNMPEVHPWSFGFMMKNGGSRTTVVLERFSVREKIFAAEEFLVFDEMYGASFNSVSREGAVRTGLLAVRAEKTWEIRHQKLLAKLGGIRPLAGVFGGMSMVTNHEVAEETTYSRFCMGRDACFSGADVELKPERKNAPYLGVVVGAARKISKNTDARVELDVHSTEKMKLRANIDWAFKIW